MYKNLQRFMLVEHHSDIPPRQLAVDAHALENDYEFILFHSRYYYHLPPLSQETALWSLQTLLFFKGRRGVEEKELPALPAFLKRS
jgi:hypothetical protein